MTKASDMLGQQVREASREPLIVDRHGKAKPVLANAIIMLREAPEWEGVLGYNEFALQTVALKPPPWRKEPGTNWTSVDDIQAADWLQRIGVLVSPQVAADAAQVVAAENCFHPVRDYLDSLTWDKKKRLDSWLTAYLGARDDAFTRAVGPRYLISGCARILRPGCQADYVLVLEGGQGIQKSKALQTLAGDWFTDHLSSLDNKDARLELHGVWIVELGELTNIRGLLTEKVKAFLTARRDRFRPPYARRAIDVARTNVFAGSVNDQSYLVDETGNRRFWPVRCGRIDIEALEKDRDRLWAEALVRYRAGDPWWLETDELNALAAEEQEQRYEPGPWDETILPWLENPVQREERDSASCMLPIEPFRSARDRVTIEDVLVHAIGKDVKDFTQRDQTTVARCLTHVGWVRKRATRAEADPNGHRPWFYRRPGTFDD